jgi:hypothetical protein
MWEHSFSLCGLSDFKMERKLLQTMKDPAIQQLQEQT